MKQRQGSRNSGPSAGNADKVSGRTETKPLSNAQEEAKPAQAGETLTKADREQLQQLETTIGSGLASFVQVGHALSQINANRLYREVSDTFENYCAQKWDLSREYGYRLINAAKCYDSLKSKLPQGAPLPLNESQLRPMVDALKPGQWVQAWKQVIAETSGVRLTAEAVEKVVRGLGGQSGHAEPVACKKAMPNVPKGLATAVGIVDSALANRGATKSDLQKALRSIRCELKKLQVGRLRLSE